MVKRTGEKIGWMAGWLGGFFWVFALSIMFLIQDKWLQGLWGFFLFGLAVLSILFLAPWRHPSTAYWKLMVLPYSVFLGSAAWALWSFGGLKVEGLDGWTLLWLLPLLIPVGVLCKRKWSDFDG